MEQIESIQRLGRVSMARFNSVAHSGVLDNGSPGRHVGPKKSGKN